MFMSLNVILCCYYVDGIYHRKVVLNPFKLLFMAGRLFCKTSFFKVGSHLGRNICYSEYSGRTNINKACKQKFVMLYAA